jgi:hypothetical protein
MASFTPVLLALALMVACAAAQQCASSDDSTLTARGCDSDTISLKCDAGTIQIVGARYGGRTGNTCVNKMSSGSPPCTVYNQTDVSKSIAAKCDGKDTCDLLVYPQGPPDNGDLVAPDSCLNQAKEALINYKCVLPCDSKTVRTLTGCDDEVKTIRCECGTIQLESAVWGGSETGKCVLASDTKFPPCDDPSKMTDVLGPLKAKCGGKADCTFKVYPSAAPFNGDFGNAADPCVNQAKQVVVKYRCGTA